MDEADKILGANAVISTYLENSDLDDAMAISALVLVLAQLITFIGTPAVLEATIEALRASVVEVNGLRSLAA